MLASRTTIECSWVKWVAVVSVVSCISLCAAAQAPSGSPTGSLLAHRGVHQLYDRTDLGRDTCTATRMLPPTNFYLENTIDSMRASFALGADILEIDIHPTTDGDFAVFHDWSVECRTNGTGTTRELSMAYLKTLDIGYGYTADDGATYPFRGKGVGLMPTLDEVLRTFSDRRFLLNFKSKDPNEADLLFRYLSKRRIDIGKQLMVYGNEIPVTRFQQVAGRASGFSKEGMKRCTKGYLLWGWTSHVPAACRNAVIGVPINLRTWMWGWPNRFLARMREHGTTVVFFGPAESANGAPGLTSAAQLNAVPEGFYGIVWVDAIEAVGPAWLARRQTQ